jgi:hypothetical protein
MLVPSPLKLTLLSKVPGVDLGLREGLVDLGGAGLREGWGGPGRGWTEGGLGWTWKGLD